MSDSGSASPPPSSSRRWVLGLLAIAVPLLLFRLGAKDVWEASEGRPLESAREMRAHGDWLVQYTNGEKDLTKPPLYAWLVGASFAVGGDTEFAGRVPSVLASIGVLLAVFVLGRRIAGPRAGFLSAVFLLTTAKFLWQARLAELETLLALGVVWAYVAWDSATAAGEDEAPSRAAWRTWLAFGGALGFAAAVKGPIAFLLVLPGVAAHAMVMKRAAVLRSGGFLLALLIAVALGLAWPAAVVLRDGRAAYETLLSFARGDNVGHLRDPFYYLAQFPLYALPWTPLVLLALRMRWARGFDPVASARARLPLVAFAVTFVALSILSAKQTHYLIPTVFPMGAVLAACWADRWIGAAEEQGRFGDFLGAGAVLVAMIAIGMGICVSFIDGDGPPPVPTIFLLLVSPVILAIVLVARVSRVRGLEATLVFVLLLAIVAEGAIVPWLNHRQSSRRFVEAVETAVPKSAPIAWTIFGSHSDYLWHFSDARVSRNGIPEILASPEATTDERQIKIVLELRRLLATGGPRYVIVTGEEAFALTDVADVVLRDDEFQRKNRSVVLMKSKERR